MIDVRHVTRRFDGVTALEDASFEVRSGEIVALLGPNGAGKTTASRIIGGILAPSEGDVLVDAVSVRQDPNTVRARCGFVTDQQSLYERMPLSAYLEFFARLYDVSAPGARAVELARLLGLDDVLGKRLGAFSRGMRQKVAIARALVHDPPVLLLDEPATALDPEMAQTLRSFIVSLRARHRAILLTTHDLDEAQRIADRVVVLYKGRVIRIGATSEIRAVGSRATPSPSPASPPPRTQPSRASASRPIPRRARTASARCASRRTTRARRTARLFALFSMRGCAW